MTDVISLPTSTTMRAVVRDAFGTSDVLRLAEIPRPSPSEDEVLIRVGAASVGAWDWHDLHGEPYAMRLTGMGVRRPRNRSLGVDVAGEVVAVGAACSEFSPGDLVYGAGKGTFAEYAVASPSSLAPKPARLSFAEAASMPVAGSTALIGLRDQGRVQPGEQVLLIGAAGGVGTFAVQIAAHMGATVTAVCSAESADVVRSLGAAHVIDYATHDFTETLRRYDLIFQIAGDAAPSTCRRLLTPEGRLVLCSGDGGGRFLGPIGRIARGVLMSPFVSQKITTFVADAEADKLEALTSMIDQGYIAPVIDATFALEDAAEAVRSFEQGHGPGKIVIVV